MKCARCRKKIPDTALRCRFCKQPVNRGFRGVSASRVAGAISGLRRVFASGKEEEACRWSLVDVAIVLILIVLFAVKDPFRIGLEITDLLRLRFSIFTKEPKLFYFLGVSVQTIVFKIAVTIFVAFAVMLRRVPLSSLVGPLSIKPQWRMNLAAYGAFCVLLSLISSYNPLLPNIPFNSVFPEALLFGNCIAILSILFVAPLIEEVVFRGFLYPAINKAVGMHIAVIITSVLFAAAHYPQMKGEPGFFFVIFTLGVTITYARALTRSTWVAIVMHHLYNLAYVTVGFINFIIIRY
ncbi:MAG: CPBP family glutamic-type intramembrane protease [Candidatus Omnitrophota bacterium]